MSAATPFAPAASVSPCTSTEFPSAWMRGVVAWFVESASPWLLAKIRL
jgi:hypothetical protein